MAAVLHHLDEETYDERCGRHGTCDGSRSLERCAPKTGSSDTDVSSGPVAFSQESLRDN